MDDPGKLLRLFREINLLASSKRGYTVTELADRLGVSYRTVYRDLKIFEKTGFEVIQLKSKRYRMARAEEVSKNITFDNQEADALRQALMTLGDSTTKNLLLDKVTALSDSAVKVDLFKKTAISGHIKQISDAISNQKQVMLMDYQSINSNKISNRYVEPFAFSESGDAIQCLEISSKINKFFKLERIGQVKVLDRDWEHDFRHETQKEDIFGMSLKNGVLVKLEMGMLSYNLLKEEYPASATFLKSESSKKFYFEGKVEGFKAIGRFILGLMEDITVIEPKELKTFLRQKIKSKKIF